MNYQFDDATCHRIANPSELESAASIASAAEADREARRARTPIRHDLPAWTTQDGRALARIEKSADGGYAVIVCRFDLNQSEAAALQSALEESDRWIKRQYDAEAAANLREDGYRDDPLTSPANAEADRRARKGLY